MTRERVMVSPNVSKSAIPVSIRNKQETPSQSSTPKPSKCSVSFPNAVDSHLLSLRKSGRLSEAVAALDSLAQKGSSKVSPETFMNLIQLCTESNSVHLGRKIHERIGLVCEKITGIETKLIGMYAKCGFLRDAREVFEKMQKRNLFSWSAMIGGCSREQMWEEAVKLFYRMMVESVLPDGFLLPRILQACGKCGDVETVRLIHCLVVKCGLGNQQRVSNSIVAMYAKCGMLGWARKYFRSMEEKDTVAWNSMISGYSQSGKIEEAHRLFGAMCEAGIEPNSVTWNILVAGYYQAGRYDVAMEFMRKMEACGIKPNVVAWTTMISGSTQNNRENEALSLFQEMILAGVRPTGVTITSAASACASLRLLNKGLQIHSIAVKFGCLDDILVGNSFIDMYAKCGELEAAQWVFDKMPEKDVYTWNSMIAGYCQAGYCGKANMLFMKIQKSDIQPDVVTWNTMISGYIRNGDEDHAVDLFWRMEKTGKIKQDTASWNILIAGYVQLGEMEKAFGMFRQMQSFGVRPNRVTMRSLLPACANSIALKKVKEIYGYLMRRNLDPTIYSKLTCLTLLPNLDR